jgi:hypothetical protein
LNKHLHDLDRCLHDLGRRLHGLDKRLHGLGDFYITCRLRVSARICHFERLAPF